MTFIEALKTGKAIRRKGWDFWWSPKSCYYIHARDALAEDWEAGEKTIEVGKEQFIAACTRAQEIVVHQYKSSGKTNLYDEFTRILSEELRLNTIPE